MLGFIPLAFAMGWRAANDYTPLSLWIENHIADQLAGGYSQVYENVYLFLLYLGAILSILGEARLLRYWAPNTRGWIVMNLLSMAAGALLIWPVGALFAEHSPLAAWLVAAVIDGLIWGALILVLLRAWGWRTRLWMRMVCGALFFGVLAVAVGAQFENAPWPTLGPAPEQRGVLMFYLSLFGLEVLWTLVVGLIIAAALWHYVLPHGRPPAESPPKQMDPSSTTASAG